MGVVVSIGQVLNVLGVGAAARGLLEHIPPVVVGRHTILGVKPLHLVVPPSVHGRRVGIRPHPMPCRPTVLGRRETSDTFGHRIHNVWVDVAALVEPCEGQFQRVQVGYIVGVIQRPEHNLALHVAHFEEVGLGGTHVLTALARREPVEEGLDRRILQLAHGFTDDGTACSANAVGVGGLHAGAAHDLER